MINKSIQITFCLFFLALFLAITIRGFFFEDDSGSWNLISVSPEAFMEDDKLVIFIQQKIFKGSKNILSHGGNNKELVLSKLVELTIALEKEGQESLVKQQLVHEKSAEIEELDFQSVLASRVRLARAICKNCSSFESLDVDGNRVLSRVTELSGQPDKFKFVEFNVKSKTIQCEFTARDIVSLLSKIYLDKTNHELLAIVKDLTLSINESGNGYYFRNSHDGLSSGQDFLIISGCGESIQAVQIQIEDTFLRYGPIISFGMNDIGYIYAVGNINQEDRWSGVIDQRDHSIFKFPTFSKFKLLDTQKKRIIFYDLKKEDIVKIWIVDLITRSIKKISFNMKT